MTQHITMHVGLDVHKDSTAIAVAERDRPDGYAVAAQVLHQLRRLVETHRLGIQQRAGKSRSRP